MNILPKKSWHVRNRRNIDRVRRDEAEAERKTKIEQDRVLQVEQEHRLRELRARHGLAEQVDGKHFTLFPELEPQSSSSSSGVAKYHTNRQGDSTDQSSPTTRSCSNTLGRSDDTNMPWYLHKPRQAARPEPQARTSTVSDRFSSIYNPVKRPDEKGRMSQARQSSSACQTRHDSRLRDDPSRSRCHLEYHRETQDRVPVVEIDSSPEILRVVEPKRKHRERRRVKRVAD